MTRSGRPVPVVPGAVQVERRLPGRGAACAGVAGTDATGSTVAFARDYPARIAAARCAAASAGTPRTAPPTPAAACHAARTDSGPGAPSLCHHRHQRSTVRRLTATSPEVLRPAPAPRQTPRGERP